MHFWDRISALLALLRLAAARFLARFMCFVGTYKRHKLVGQRQVWVGFLASLSLHLNLPTARERDAGKELHGNKQLPRRNTTSRGCSACLVQPGNSALCVCPSASRSRRLHCFNPLKMSHQLAQSSTLVIKVPLNSVVWCEYGERRTDDIPWRLALCKRGCGPIVDETKVPRVQSKAKARWRGFGQSLVCTSFRTQKVPRSRPCLPQGSTELLS